MFYPAVRSIHVRQVVTARVCALGALVGSPAVFFLARAIVSACSYLANPWTGWPFWTQTHEGAFVMYLAGTMLCIKVVAQVYMPTGASTAFCVLASFSRFVHLRCMHPRRMLHHDQHYAAIRRMQ